MMRIQKTPFAIAAAALCAAAPFAADAAPTVSWRAPAAGATISQSINNTSACEVTGLRIDRVVFSIRRSGASSWTALNTEQNSPWRCNIDVSRFTTGSYTLRAVAYDTANASATTTRSINISNGTTSNTPPTLSITSPTAGQTVSGTVNCAANASDSNGITRVQFFLDGSSTALANDTSSPYTCSINTTTLSNGSHTLRAVATDSLGATQSTQVSFNVSNATSGGGTTTPTVRFTAPANGATIGSTINQSTSCQVSATTISGRTIRQVQFFLDTTALNTELNSPYQCNINPANHTNGAHVLRARVTDSSGASAETQISVNIANGIAQPTQPTEPPPPTGGTGSGATALPANGARGVPTFESLGMYWQPGSNPGAAGCSLRYRKHSESNWRQALPMWYDARNGECRGSIVHLEPGTDYAVEMGTGTNFTTGVNVRTWSDNFPIARTVQVQSGSGTLAITEGGTAQGYVLYTGPATLDAGNGQDYNVTIAAPYVIVRGLTLRGARRDGIRMLDGAHDVVIEDNDISGWGRDAGMVVGGVQRGTERDSGIRADCIARPFLERTVVQRNRIHHPRYGANSWDFGHPLGPVGINYDFCGGHHVMRYNEIYSSDGHYFKDGIGGQDNFSASGFPVSDTDIYGNIVRHAWDDGIEAEGGNRNVRIWGNYIDQTGIGIATTVVHHGPLYMFRNVYNRSRFLAVPSPDNDDRWTFAKSGTRTFGDGRRYVFHNTLLQATQAGLQFPLGAAGGLNAAGSDQPLTNTVSRNNIFHVWKSGTNATITTQGGGGNDLDYDLRNGGVNAYAGAETNGIMATPMYRSGHGWQSWAGGNYQLDPLSRGFDEGVRLPNFNDGYTGSAPDMGAHEGDTPPMRFGVGGASAAAHEGTGSASTAITGTTTTADSGSGGGGVCSTISCAAQ